MPAVPESLKQHRVGSDDMRSVVDGVVRYSPIKSLWFTAMSGMALVGGALTFTWTAFAVFVLATGCVLLFGHSLGSHRKLIHDSFQCPKWLEYLLVYCGVQVGLAGPLGLLRQHELRDYAQRLPDCHDYLRHGRGFWRDGWWQIHCELVLDSPPAIQVEERLARDSFYRLLERTWMLQQLPPALLLFAIGGWSFVIWGVCARITAGIFGHWLIGHFAHNHGPMHMEVDGAAVQGHNIRFTSLLTMGECWHNNHHAYPGSARLGLHPGEWDPGWWTLCLLHKAGLVWRLRMPHDLPPRTELRCRDDLVWSPETPALEVQGLRAAMRACSEASPATAVCWSMTGPAANLSVQAFGKIAGARLSFVRDASVKRLMLANAEHRLLGLPALILVLRLRNRLFLAPAMALMPIAIMWERLRGLSSLKLVD